MRRHATNLARMMFFSFGLGGWAFAAQEFGPPLPGTKPLTMRGDIASDLVAGVDRFLLQQIDESTARRPAYWKRVLSSARAYEASIEPNRKRLAHILGGAIAVLRPRSRRHGRSIRRSIRNIRTRQQEHRKNSILELAGLR